jgi:hypothetical protein
VLLLLQQLLPLPSAMGTASDASVAANIIDAVAVVVELRAVAAAAARPPPLPPPFAAASTSTITPQQLLP